MFWLWMVPAILLIVTIFYYNRFIRIRNAIREATATMDVYFKKRFDLVPNIVETVRGYALHEKMTLEELVRARTAVQRAGTTDERLRGEKEMSSALKSLFAVAEGYPELKSNENFLELQGTLARIENEIANARRYYNGSVKQWNNAVEMFPGNLFAKLFRFRTMSPYEVDDASERDNIRVSF